MVHLTAFFVWLLGNSFTRRSPPLVSPLRRHLEQAYTPFDARDAHIVAPRPYPPRGKHSSALCVSSRRITLGRVTSTDRIDIPAGCTL
jgi:hypothetical protein